MSSLFQKSFAFQCVSLRKESGLDTASSFSSSSSSSSQEKKISLQKSLLKHESCQNVEELTQNDMFQEVKEWFSRKNVKIGNPEEIIQKAKMTQRQQANNKVTEQKDELSLSSSGLRERRLKKSLTLLI